MKKRVISLILAVLMVVTLLPVSAFALRSSITITSQPSSITVRPGDSATFSISAVNSGDYMYYVWYDADKMPVSKLQSIASKYEHNSAVGITDLWFWDVAELTPIITTLGDAVLGYDFSPNKESSTLTLSNVSSAKTIQCLIFTNTEKDLSSLNISSASDLLGMTGLKITGYKLSDTVTLTVDPNAPCQNHTMSDVAGKAPTCTEPGWNAYRQCSVCGYNTKTVIPAAGHSYGEWVVAQDAGCTQSGMRSRTCAVCGSPETEAIPATGHAFGDWEITKDATCTAAGEQSRRCDFCGEVETSPVAIKEHSYESGKCIYCGEKDPNYVEKPGTPKVTVTNVTSTGKIKLTWAKVTGAAKYEVYRSTSKSGGYSKLTTVTGTSLTNSSAKAGTTYYYKVRAISSTGTAGSFSNVVLRCCDCAQPTVTLSNVASTGKIKISWAKVDGAQKYEVYRATSKTGTYSRISTVTGTSLINNKANAGKTYYYKVKAIGSKTDANSAFSAVKSIVCDLPAPVVKITLANGDPKLSWAKVDGAAKYEIYRATSKTGTYTKLTSTAKTSVVNTSAKAGKTYYYKVKAISKTSAANSAYSSVVSIKAK